MKKRYSILLGIALLGLLMWLLSSCTREAWQGSALSPAADSLLRADLPSARKVKFTAPVTITIQRGHTNTATSAATDNTKAGQKHGRAATGAGSTAAGQPAVIPYWVLVLLAASGGAIGFWVRAKI